MIESKCVAEMFHIDNVFVVLLHSVLMFSLLLPLHDSGKGFPS
jgi:hypothetical protein